MKLASEISISSRHSGHSISSCTSVSTTQCHPRPTHLVVRPVRVLGPTRLRTVGSVGACAAVSAPPHTPHARAPTYLRRHRRYLTSRRSATASVRTASPSRAARLANRSRNVIPATKIGVSHVCIQQGRLSAEVPRARWGPCDVRERQPGSWAITMAGLQSACGGWRPARSSHSQL